MTDTSRSLVVQHGPDSHHLTVFQPHLVNITEASISKPVIRLAKKKLMTILLIGETGVGKTSFLSLLINLFTGRRPGEFALFHNPENESNLSSSHSQTNEAIMYQLCAQDGTQVQILDTPGLADTRGLDRDKAHRTSIIQAIRLHVTTVDAVVVLVNGTQERLGAATEYALTVIGSMFPRSISGNISFMLTHVNDALSMNFSSSSLPFGLQTAKKWTIQNPIAQFMKYRELAATNMPESELEELYKALAVNFEKTVKMLANFMHWVDSCTPQPTTAIQELFDVTMAIESQVVNVFARISQQEERRAALNQLNNELQTSRQTMKINEKFETIMTKEIMTQKETPGHNTICTVGGCYSNCHLECELDFILDPKEIGKRCSVFQNYGVNECYTCGHSSDDHRHYHAIWAAISEEESVYDNQAKVKYDFAKMHAATLETQTEAIEDALQRMNSDIMGAENQIGVLCAKFGECALTGSFSGHLNATIRILILRYEGMKNSGADAASLHRMEESIDHIQKKLAVIQRASGSLEKNSD